MAVAAIDGWNGNDKTSGTTLAVDHPAVSLGQTLVLGIAFDNTATTTPFVSSITVPAGETASWTRIGSADASAATAGNAARIELWAITVTVAWPSTPVFSGSGTTKTITLSAAVTAKAYRIVSFAAATSTPRSGIPVGTTGAASASTAGTVSATTAGSTPTAGDLVLGLAVAEGTTTNPTGDTDTVGGSWLNAPPGNGSFGTTGGSAATNISALLQYKILTASGHQTFNPACPVGDASALVVALAAAPALVASASGTGQTTGSAAATVYTPPKTESLVDTFDSFVNLSLWTQQQTPTIVSGQLALDSLNAYEGLFSSTRYSFQGSYVFAKITPPVPAASRETAIAVRNAAGDAAIVLIAGSPRSLIPRLHAAAGSNVDTGAITYDPVAHAWLRVRLSGTTVSWDASPDGLTWTNWYSTTTTYNLSAATVELTCGQFAAEADTQVGYFDNLNTSPPWTASATGTGAFTGSAAAIVPLTASASGSGTSTGSAAATIVSPAKVETLVDSFDTTIDAKWAKAGSPVIESGRLRLDTTAGVTAVTTVSTYDLTESAVFVQIQPPSAPGNRLVAFLAQRTNGDGPYFLIDGDPLTLEFWIAPSGTLTVLPLYKCSLSLSCGQWQAEADTQPAYFDNLVIWTNRMSRTTALNLVAVKVSLQAQNTGGSVLPAYLDNLNIPGTSTGTNYAATATGTGQTDGSAAAGILNKATATGTGQSTGSAAVTLLLSSSATGTGQTAGQAAPTTLAQPTATGTGQTTGSAAPGVIARVSASGTGQTAGSAGPIVYNLASANGISYSTGTATASVLTQASATGTGASTGSVAGNLLAAAAATGSGVTVGSAGTTLYAAAVAIGSVASAGSAAATVVLPAIPVITGWAWSSASGTLVLDPTKNATGSPPVAGNWMLAVLGYSAASGNRTPAAMVAPWTERYPVTGVGTMAWGALSGVRQAGDTSYTFSLISGSGTPGWLLIWGAGALPDNDWIFGTFGLRNGAVSQFTATAPSISVTDNTLVLAVAVERTVASELITDLSVDNGFALYAMANPTTASEDIAQRTFTTGAVVGNTTMTWPNPHANNAVLALVGVTRVAPLNASGTGQTSGSAAASQGMAATATGTGQTTGSAAASIAFPVSASGSGSSAGSAAVTLTAVESATGTGASGGSAAGGVLAAASATGTGASTGSAAATLRPSLTASASGSGTSTGSAAATVANGPIVYAAASIGTGQTDGSAATRVMWRPTATGSGQTDGSASTTVVLSATATGSGSSAGSAEVIVTLAVTATGTGGSAGSVTAALVMRVSASGSGLCVGSADLVILVGGGKPRVWTGSAFETKPVKVWNGTSWVVKPMKRWDGATWVLV